MLPGGMLGPELARQARLLCPRLPVLFTTGYGGPAAADAVPGATVIDKPFGLAELAIRIRAVLDADAPAAGRTPVLAMERSA